MKKCSDQYYSVNNNAINALNSRTKLSDTFFNVLYILILSHFTLVDKIF